MGAVAGGLVALPILLLLANLAAPFGGKAVETTSVPDMLATLPPALWFALPSLPVIAAVIGYVTTQSTVRRWLRRLP
jgi:cell division transport system permease protein